MSTQGNSPAPVYSIEKLQAKLEGQDPFVIQEGQVAALEAAIEGVSDSQLRQAEVPGKWSILEVIQHLADTELAYGWRLRMILAQDNPPLQGFDQDLWTQNLGYNEVKLEDALDQLRAIRAANLRLYRQCEDRLDRTGLHSEAGPISARMILYILANHDRVHLRQIERIKEHLGL